MDYVDRQNKIMKHRLHDITNKIRQITHGSRESQNQPETRAQLRLLEGTHKLLLLQKQARLEQKLFTQITVTKDMASKRFYESMRQFKKTKRMINKVSYTEEDGTTAFHTGHKHVADHFYHIYKDIYNTADHPEKTLN